MNVSVPKLTTIDRDVLSHVCSRLSNDDLRKLCSSLGLWDEVNAMLRGNSFWKMRVESIIGRHLASSLDGDWKREFYLPRIILQLFRARPNKREVSHCFCPRLCLCR